MPTLHGMGVVVSQGALTLLAGDCGTAGKSEVFPQAAGGGGGGGRKTVWKVNQTCTSTYPMLIFPTIGIPYLLGMLKLPEIAVATIT